MLFRANAPRYDCRINTRNVYRDANSRPHSHTDANSHAYSSHTDTNCHTHGYADPNADSHTDRYADPDPHDATAPAKPDSHVHAHPAYKHAGAPATTDATTAAPNQSYTNSQELRRPFSVTKRMLDER